MRLVVVVVGIVALCFIPASAKPDSDLSHFTLGLENSANNPLAREKRTVSNYLPPNTPLLNLRDFRRKNYITNDEQTAALEGNNKNVVIFRFTTAHFHHFNFTDVTAVLVKGSDEWKSVQVNVTEGFQDDIPDYSTKVEDLKVTNIQDAGLNDDNATLLTISVTLIPKESGSGYKLIKTLNRNLTRFGRLGRQPIQVEDLFRKAFSMVAPKTVYQVFLKLDGLKYMPQFEDLNNTATLKITDQLVGLTRPMMRNRFGEYFFRSLVLEYYKDPINTFTVANVAFLVEQNEDNFVDMDLVWRGQFDGFGAIGEYPLRSDSFVVYPIDYVPEEFLQFLVAEETRASRSLDQVEFMKKTGIPAFCGLVALIVIIIFCAWEGWCCKMFIEHDKGCCCCMPSSEDFENYQQFDRKDSNSN